MEETRLELEVEKERHSVELEELQMQVAELTKKRTLESADGPAVIAKEDETKEEETKKVKRDGAESVSPSIMSGMTIETRNGVADDADDDYVKRLEDELEDVTEQLIEAETSISDME